MLKPGGQTDGDEALEFYAKHTAQIEVKRGSPGTARHVSVCTLLELRELGGSGRKDRSQLPQSPVCVLRHVACPLDTLPKPP